VNERRPSKKMGLRMAIYALISGLTTSVVDPRTVKRARSIIKRRKGGGRPHPGSKKRYHKGAFGKSAGERKYKW